jgi:hypothetical protein
MRQIPTLFIVQRHFSSRTLSRDKGTREHRADNWVRLAKSASGAAERWLRSAKLSMHGEEGYNLEG